MKNINKQNALKILFLLIVLFSPFIVSSSEIENAPLLNMENVGFYQTNTCEFSLSDFAKTNYTNKEIVLKIDRLSTIDCFGKINGADIVGNRINVYVGTNLTINLFLQSIIWIILISMLKSNKTKPNNNMILYFIISIFFTSQIVIEKSFYSASSRNYSGMLTQDNYFLISIFLAYYLIFVLIDNFVTPRLENVINYFPFIFLITGTFLSSNINFFVMLISFYGIKNLNLSKVRSKYSVTYIVLVFFWFFSQSDTVTFFDVDKIRGFISSSNSGGAILFWSILLYLIVNGIIYLFELSKNKLNMKTLTNNFLIIGFFTVMLGISGALNTYLNFFNYYFLGQNKVGIKSLSSVAGNTWRGLSSSAESIGEFYGVAIILFFYISLKSKKISIFSLIGVISIIYGLYKANNVASILLICVIVFYIASKSFISNFQKRYIGVFLILFIFVFVTIFSFLNPGVGTDYDFLSQNLIIESLKYSKYFEYGENKEFEKLIYESNYKDILKFTNYEDNVSITTDFLIRKYVSDSNIGYLPNPTSLISFASSYINRTEKWALFISRYNPTYSELIIGSGPFQINNYYYSDKIKSIDGLILPHSGVLNVLIFFGLTGILFIIYGFFIYLSRTKENIFKLLFIFLIINYLKSDSILYFSSFVMTGFIFMSSKSFSESLK
tara:strand:- start:1957 stop:3957 length:2001 start_codon:yes stop_codon:yes gene_type:complete